MPFSDMLAQIRQKPALEEELRKSQKLNAEVLSREDKFYAVTWKDREEIQTLKETIAKLEKELRDKREKQSRVEKELCVKMEKHTRAMDWLKQHKDYRSEGQVQMLTETIQQINKFMVEVYAESGPPVLPMMDTLYKPN